MTLPHEMIVIDGGSEDGTRNWPFHQNDILTILQHNGIAKNGETSLPRSGGYYMNLDFKPASCKYICMLSDDFCIHRDAVMNEYHLMEADINHKIGACAFLFRDCFLYDQFFVYMFQDKVLVNFGICRKEILQTLGWIDEKNFKFYLTDTFPNMVIEALACGIPVVATDVGGINEQFG